jgi:hypothetical protein
MPNVIIAGKDNQIAGRIPTFAGNSLKRAWIF